MPTFSPITTKFLQHAEEGELIAFPNYEAPADYAVVLSKHDNGQVVIAVLQSTQGDQKTCFHTACEPNVACVSFGKDWVFEVVLDPTGAEFGDTNLRSSVGNWSVDGGMVVLRIGRDPYRTTSGPMNLELNALRPAPGYSFHVTSGTRWRIWQTAADRADEQKVPLVQRGLD